MTTRREANRVGGQQACCGGTELSLSREDLARRIGDLAAEGLTAAEVGVRLDMTEQRVRRIASAFHVRFPRSSGRRLGVQISRERYTVIRGLAEGAEVSPSIMLARIAACVVDEGLQVAARRLGREAHLCPQGRRLTGAPPTGNTPCVVPVIAKPPSGLRFRR
jgi:hypothetical protein